MYIDIDIQLAIMTLAKCADLDRMISETKENIRCLRNTVSNSHHHPAYLAKSEAILGNYELQLSYLEKAVEVVAGIKSFPLGMKLNCYGEVFTVRSHSLNESCELWSGLVNAKELVMAVPVESMLKEIAIGRVVRLS
ncbi:TPA: hypothetical protein KD020_003819 [Vibrio parahaemolyticus]|nr:hypothetical protein [Vibrio parahaemolyticus]HBC3544476.1 hypothetical protein [Vibrio parahaemolyticus]